MNLVWNDKMKLANFIQVLFVFCLIPGLQRIVKFNMKIAGYFSEILDKLGFSMGQKLAKELRSPDSSDVHYKRITF